jgi:arabinose-5-phosphate isomerase
VVLVTDGVGVLTGLFTDSDLARLLEKQRENQFDRAMSEVMTKTPVTIASGERTSVAVETLACRNLSELPVVNHRGQPVGLIDITDVLSFFPAA